MLTTYYLSMKCIPMWSCRLLNLGTPVVALLAEYFWLRSAISVNQLVGLVLVVMGAGLVILRGTPAVRKGTQGPS